VATEDLIAVVDLGSNSFHMAIASIGKSGIRIVDRVKHKVYLSSGLDDDSVLDDAAIARGVEAMGRFAQRLKGEKLWKVRIVATHTMRVAKNIDQIIDAFRQVFDYPVEVIDGVDEARLIFTAVAHTTHHEQSKRLVVDIGGGSTELIIGEGYQPIRLSSHSLGSNLFTKKYFSEEKITSRNFFNAINRVKADLEIYYRAYRKEGWDVAIGTSGTVKHVASLVEPDANEPSITLAGLLELKSKLIEYGTVEHEYFERVPQDRRTIIPGGLAVLIGVFQLLKIKELHFCDAGLREGVIYQELWHLEHTDIRERTVGDLIERHRLPQIQATRVQETSVALFEQIAKEHKHFGYYRSFLRWAAMLHEVGRAIRIQNVHQHSGYIVSHSPMPGFSIEQQAVLAWLVTNHRKGINIDALSSFPQHDFEMLRVVLVCLRSAVTLHRSRASLDRIPLIESNDLSDRIQFTLIFDERWLEEHPLTAFDLSEEQRRWQKRNVDLQIISNA